MSQSSDIPYVCPGEVQSVSRSIHLGRLASYYSACQYCPRRHETATLAPARVRHLERAAVRAAPPTLFDSEGVRGVLSQNLSRRDVRQLAAALGIMLRRWAAPAAGPPAVVVACDGRPLTAEMSAAASEGLRLTGCKVVDLGSATAPCLSFAIDHLPADGGLLVGSDTAGPQHVSVRFWGSDARPLSAGGRLDDLKAVFERGVDRPTRSYGPTARFQADIPYLACLHKYFHALRPLRFVIDTASRPLTRYLTTLSRHVACEIMMLGRQATPRDPAGSRGQFLPLADRVRETTAHFGIWIDGDGQRCRLVDQRGDIVPDESLLRAVLGWLLKEHLGAAVVLSHDCSEGLCSSLETAGARVVRCAPDGEATDRAMRGSTALAGGDPSGRIWFHDHQPSPDALKSLAILLTLLSQSDRDLSDVVASPK